MIYLRVDRAEKPGQPPVSSTGRGYSGRLPRLNVPRTGWCRQFASSAVALVRGPAPSKKFLGSPYFRDCWIEQSFPKAAFVLAIACHVLLIVFPPPIWTIRPPSDDPSSPQMELTWYGPVNDLPSILPLRPAPEPATASEPTKSEPQRSVDAFHPRQTIISAPLHPTHPRQTLLQPQAPPEPPKILPALPNIVQLAASEPARPKLQLTPEQLQQMRPEAPTLAKSPDAAVPEVSLPEKRIDVVNLASSTPALPKPALPVVPMSAPRAVQAEPDAGVAAPQIALPGSGGPATLIALSATPAPVAPPPNVPPGNLTARFSISPEGPKPGSPSSAPADRATAGVSGGGHGPEGIFITGGNPAHTAPSSGLGIGAATRLPIEALPSRPMPRVMIPPLGSKPLTSGPRPDTLAPGAPPEAVLGSKRVYTLYMNMPNLTSASGSWILNFADMDDDAGEIPHPQSGVPELTGPVPLRKVDPKYPPELRAAHVDGEVLLYAIIRKDGSVDSIQLMRGIDPQLDANAMEAFAQWKFRPAERNGVPVDLEAIVHIPFRSRTPTPY